MPDVIATYYFRPRSDTKPDQAAQAICEEETTVTWIDVSTRTGYVKRLDGSVESVKPQGQGYITRIRYPAEIFEPGNIAFCNTGRLVSTTVRCSMAILPSESTALNS